MEWFSHNESLGAYDRSNTIKFLLYELSLPSFGVLFLLSQHLGPLWLCMVSLCYTIRFHQGLVFFLVKTSFQKKWSSMKLSAQRRTECSQPYSTLLLYFHLLYFRHLPEVIRRLFAEKKTLQGHSEILNYEILTDLHSKLFWFNIHHSWGDLHSFFKSLTITSCMLTLGFNIQEVMGKSDF